MARKKIFLEHKKAQFLSRLEDAQDVINDNLISFLTKEGIPFDGEVLTNLIYQKTDAKTFIDSLKPKTEGFIPLTTLQQQERAFNRLTEVLSDILTNKVQSCMSWLFNYITEEVYPSFGFTEKWCFVPEDVARAAEVAGAVYLSNEQQDYYSLLCDLRSSFERFEEFRKRERWSDYNVFEFIRSSKRLTPQELFYPTEFRNVPTRANFNDVDSLD